MKYTLRTIRFTLGYNQAEMAEKLGIDVRRLRSYEYQTKNYPNELLESLVNNLNVNLNYLITGHGEMFTNEYKGSLKLKDNSMLIENIKDFSKRLTKLQAANGLNDYSFSKITTISEGRLERLGLGKTLPDLNDINKIKKCFDVNIDWLLYGEGPETSYESENLASLSNEDIKFLKEFINKQKFTN